MWQKHRGCSHYEDCFCGIQIWAIYFLKHLKDTGKNHFMNTVFKNNYFVAEDVTE